MNSIIAITAILFGGFSAQAYETEAIDELRGHDTHQCYSYASIEGARGGYGYACTSYPMRIQVPDFRSTAQVLRSANDKIRDLTTRVEALEKKLSALETAR